VVVKSGRLRLMHLPIQEGKGPIQPPPLNPTSASLGSMVSELASEEYYGERSLVVPHQKHKVSAVCGGSSGSLCEVLLLNRQEFHRLTASSLVDDWTWFCPISKQ